VIDVDSHGSKALDDTIKEAEDANARPILLRFYENRQGSGDCAEGRKASCIA